MTPEPASGLNALIDQCRKLEAALEAGNDPSSSAAMHRFVAHMDEGRTPPGMWSPLVLSVLVMAGGLGVVLPPRSGTYPAACHGGGPAGTR